MTLWPGKPPLETPHNFYCEPHPITRLPETDFTFTPVYLPLRWMHPFIRPGTIPPASGVSRGVRNTKVTSTMQCRNPKTKALFGHGLNSTSATNDRYGRTTIAVRRQGNSDAR